MICVSHIHQHPLLAPSPPSAALSIVCTFSVHTINLLTREPLADCKALLPPSLAARYAMHTESMTVGKRSIPYPRDDLKIAIPCGGGPSSAALALSLAVGAREGKLPQHIVVGRPMAQDDAWSALPPGWTKHWSNSWQKHYWFNTKTGKQSWEHPGAAGGR